MRYGHFDDQNKEYVIDRVYTLDVETLEERLCSNTAGGYAFYKDARLRRITRYRYNNLPLDQDGFHIYIKDGNTVWNPGGRPCDAKPEKYECRHGMGYTTITGVKKKIEAFHEI